MTEEEEKAELGSELRSLQPNIEVHLPNLGRPRNNLRSSINNSLTGTSGSDRDSGWGYARQSSRDAVRESQE